MTSLISYHERIAVSCNVKDLCEKMRHVFCCRRSTQVCFGDETVPTSSASNKTWHPLELWRVFCCESPGILWKLSSKLMKWDLKLKDLKALFYNMKHYFPTSPINNYFTNLSLNWYSSPLTLSLSKSSAPSAGDARSLSSEGLPGISAMNLGSVKVF